MSSEFSARETGTVAAQGIAVADEFAVLKDPTTGLVPTGLANHIEGIDRREFRLDKRYLPGVSEVALQAILVRVPDHEKTRDQNNHGLVFGQLLLEGLDEGEHSLHVAVKPFDTAEEAAREYAVSGYFATGNVPHCDTFLPLGVMRTRTGRPAIITHYRHPVRSMDGIFWNPDLIDETEIVDKALGRAGVSLALLHAAGWAHGDAQAKNIAWDILKPQDDTVVIDLEDARPLAHLDPAEQYAAKVQDLEVFIGSLRRLTEAGVELPTGFDQQVKEHFGLVYVGKQDTTDGEQSRVDISTISALVDSHEQA